MTRIIAIDPGTRLCGYAVFDGGEPVAAGVVKSSAATVEGRAIEMAYDIPYGISVNVVVVERPVIYPDRKERDSDIVDLAVTAGVVSGAFTASCLDTPGALELIMPTPREWKGSTPKAIHNERTKAACPAAVALIEKSVPKGQRNHVWDAVGLALWQMERTSK